MRRGATSYLTIGLLGLAGGAELGCRADNPPPPTVPVPARGNIDSVRRSDPIKPPPAPHVYSELDVVPGFDDVPLVSQRPPEQRAFVDAYQRVGRPRITVFVNRTLEGELIPVNRATPVASVESVRRATTGVSVEQRQTYTRTDRWQDDQRERVDRFDSQGPGEYRESVEVYLRPGEYDEIHAKSLDYEAMETILTDWLAANGQVAIISPTMVRQRLSDEQIKDLQSGRPQVAREIARQLGTDVLVQVQARPTRQTPYGLEVRLIAEAFNIEGGDSIGRAVVDVPPPLEKRTLNKYTRYIARKLMDDMTYAWSSAGPAPQQDRDRADGARPEEQRAPAPAPGPQTAPELAPAPAPAPTQPE